MIADSELILRDDGSIYHLGIRPGEVAPTIITVGDPQRVEQVSKYFDKIEVQRSKREFVTHTGTMGGKRLTVISTGIGTDNIDIVFQELDALFNIDFATRSVKENITPLRFIRMGTSGSVHAEVEVDSLLSSTYAIGLDNLMQHYQCQHPEKDLAKVAETQAQSAGYDLPLYAYAHDPFIALPTDISEGITVTCPGFYGPQNRQLRLAKVWPEDLWSRWSGLEYQGLRITNYEMETAGIFGLARELGHGAMSINAILANRVTGRFSSTPQKTVARMIEMILERL